MKKSSTPTVVALLALGAGVGWVGHGWYSGAVVDQARLEAAVATGAAETYRAEAESLALAGDSVRRVAREAVQVAEATPPPTPSVIVRLRVDTLLMEVSDTVRMAVAPVVDELLARLDSAVADSEREREAREAVAATLWVTEQERDRWRDGYMQMELAKVSLQHALDEVTRPTPWYRSRIALGVYAAGAGAVIDRVFR